MLILIVAFGLFLIQVAYGLVANTILSGRIIFDVLSLVVAVEGVLLGLLSISPDRHEATKFAGVAGLAFILFTAILLSLSTIISAEANPPIRADVLSTFFLTSVWLFAVVVIGFARMIIET